MTNDSGQPFSFDDAFNTPTYPAVPTTIPVEAAPLRLPSHTAVPAPQSAPKRRGQSLAWISLSLAMVGALAVGCGLYFALASIELSANPFETASDWMTLTIAGLCILVVVLATSIVAVIRARPRTAAVLALVATLVLPAVAAIVGFKFGVDAFTANTQDQATAMGKGVLGALEDTLERYQIDPGPIVSFLLDLLG